MAGEIIALFGPTGVGKTAIAIALATRLRAQGEDPVAVSADALQVYRGLELLTGTASAGEQALLEHRLVSFLDVRERCSVGRYAALAHAEIDGLLAAGSTPLVVGGTGLYLRAALTQLALRPPPPAGVRERLAAELEQTGAAQAHAALAQRAPWAAAAVHPNDRHRLLRTLELEAIGALSPPAAGPSQLWSADMRRPTRLIGIVMERDALCARIEARIDGMLAAGVQEQVRAADRAGASQTARRALGFDALLSGDVEEMRTQSRRYAKRQLTWMRKLSGIEIHDVTGLSADAVASSLR